MNFKTSTGQIAITDHAIMQSVENFSTTAIAANSPVSIDTTNMSLNEATMSVQYPGADDGFGLMGVAQDGIPAATVVGGVTYPGRGQIVTNGIAKVGCASATHTVGVIMAGAATNGIAKVSAANTAGKVLGDVIALAGAGNQTTVYIYVRIR